MKREKKNEMACIIKKGRKISNSRFLKHMSVHHSRHVFRLSNLRYSVFFRIRNNRIRNKNFKLMVMFSDLAFNAPKLWCIGGSCDIIGFDTKFKYNRHIEFCAVIWKMIDYRNRYFKIYHSRKNNFWVYFWAIFCWNLMNFLIEKNCAQRC